MEQPEATGEKEYIHELIGEFRAALQKENYELPIDTDGIVILSGSPDLEKEKDEEQYAKSPDNMARIDFGARIFKEIVAKKLNKSLDTLTKEDLQIDTTPSFILNGETQQLAGMEELALACDMPKEKITKINSGERGSSNTKTQFEQIHKDSYLSAAKHLTFITTSYHVPRVLRTAPQYLPTQTNFEIIGVPLKEFSYDVYRRVRGEIKRIIAYSAKGDIAKYPQKK